MPTRLDRRQFIALAVASGSAAAGCDTRVTELEGGDELVGGPGIQQMANRLDNTTFLVVDDRDELHAHEPSGPTVYWVLDPGELKTYDLTNA